MGARLGLRRPESVDKGMPLTLGDPDTHPEVALLCGPPILRHVHPPLNPHSLHPCRVWYVPGLEDKVDMTLIDPDKFKHILRDSIRRRALLALEDRRPRQFHGMLGERDRRAC